MQQINKIVYCIQKKYITLDKQYYTRKIEK